MVDKYKKKTFRLQNRVLQLQGYEPQAVNYLLANGFTEDQLFFECENRVPVVRYRYGNKFRDYYPDIYVPHRRLIIEVKSEKTMGLLDNTHRGFSMNCAKAKACSDAGFKFCLLLMTSDGQRLRMPKNWHKMNKAELNAKVSELNPRRGTPMRTLFSL